MQLQETKIQYLDEERVFSFQSTLLENTTSFKVFVQCDSSKFVQYQKDILEDFVAEFTTTLNSAEAPDINDIKSFFEESLQLLNTKLKHFAEKVHDVQRFQIKGFIQLVVEEALMSSMIGDVTLMIMRDQKVLYSLSNSVDIRAKIDVFSDFIEGALEREDQVIYIGTKLSDVMDQHDRKEMEQILSEEETKEGVLDFLEELLVTRVEKEHIGFIINYHLKGEALNLKKRSAKKSMLNLGTAGYIEDLQIKIKNSDAWLHFKRNFLGNKYYIIAFILGLAVIFLITALLSQFTGSMSTEDKFQTQSGEYIDITIDDIQKEMLEFQTLDASSDAKSIKYAEITQKLDFLASKGKRIEDVTTLRKVLQSEYYKGFDIVHITSLEQFDDPTNGRKTRVLTFNSAETSRLGELHSITVPKNIMIGGTKAALIDSVSDASRGTLMEYNLGTNLEDCDTSLLRNGLYCYTSAGDIYLVAKSGIEPLETTDGDFKSGIGGIGTYNRNNLYVFQKNLSNIGNSLLTRYRNTAGSQTQYQAGSSYEVLNSSGTNFGDFSSFAIDGSFLAWGGGKPYLFWRPNNADTKLSYREIPIKGGDKITQDYSDNVEIITSSSTKFIHLFDRTNQTFTVYESVGTKINSSNTASYSLVYLFSFKFDLGTSKVIDVAISDDSADKPILYILSSDGVNKIMLYEFIESIKNQKALKAVAA